MGCAKGGLTEAIRRISHVLRHRRRRRRRRTAALPSAQHRSFISTETVLSLKFPLAPDMVLSLGTTEIELQVS